MKKNQELNEHKINLEDEIEEIRELSERDKNHFNILRERTISKHNEVIQKMNNENTELAMEIDKLKGKVVVLSGEVSEVREKLGKEVKKNEILCQDLIESKVSYESKLIQAGSEAEKLKERIGEVEE